MIRVALKPANLYCNSFTDEEVVDPDFQDKVKEGARVMLPFIRMCVLSSLY